MEDTKRKGGESMGLFDKLFEPSNEPKNAAVNGGAREGVVTPQSVTQIPTVSVTGSAAEEILANALKGFEGRETTIYTLKDLVSSMPAGSKKESILGVLAVTKISVEEITKDADERVSVLDATEKKLQENVAAEITQLEKEIEEAQNLIEKNREKKAKAEALVREFQKLKSEKTDEIKNILTSIN